MLCLGCGCLKEVSNGEKLYTLVMHQYVSAALQVEEWAVTYSPAEHECFLLMETCFFGLCRAFILFQIEKKQIAFLHKYINVSVEHTPL